MVFNTETIHNSFWENFPLRAKQKPSKFSFFGKKTLRSFGHLRTKTLNVDSSNWVKIIIFVFTYLIVSVYTKTIIHPGVGG